jgi:ASPIC and UnbV/FG-GAP-like repeat
VNRDGRIDLYVANDLDPNRLYVNVPSAGGLGFRFEDRGAAAAVADRNAGMGVAAADYSGDGRPDLFVTNSHRQLHGVFESGGGGRFTDARPAFAPAFDTTLAGWGVSWADLDLDGALDVALANGAIPVTNLGMDAEPIKVLSARAGSFADVSGGVGLEQAPRVNGRALAAADYDNDGDVDLAVSSIGGEIVLLRNSGADGHWLEVRLGSFAPGALVTAVLPDGRRLVREVQAGSSYLSSEDPRVHLGLGKATRIRELLVRYPDGRETRLAGVAADRIVEVGR